MLAKDIMTRKVITIKRETSVKEIIDILLKNRITGVPVVDDENKIVGIVSESDLIYKETSMPISDYWTDRKKFKNEYWKIKSTKAEEIMTTDVICVGGDTPVEEIATLMIEKRIKRLPVVRGKELVGIISRADVLKTILSEPSRSTPRW
ncbi:MAG: CBS domain-containing protein [Actinomycetota bacterium]|nr:CBS domain-containing protein [Actinomycetota bacterium]